jgi:hypothetical protein
MYTLAVRRGSTKELDNHGIFKAGSEEIQEKFDEYKNSLRVKRALPIRRIGKNAFVRDPSLVYGGLSPTEANKVYTSDGKIVPGKRKRSLKERVSGSVLLLRNETTESVYKQANPLRLDPKFQRFIYMYATVDEGLRKKYFGNKDNKALSYERIRQKFDDEKLRESFLRERMPEQYLKYTKLRGSPSSGGYYADFKDSMEKIPISEQGRAVKSYLKLLKNTVTDLTNKQTSSEGTDDFPKFLYMYATVGGNIRKKHFGNTNLSLGNIRIKFEDKNLRKRFFRESVPQEYIQFTTLRDGATGLFSSSGEYYTSFKKSLENLPEKLKGQAVKEYITKKVPGKAP